MRRSMFLAAVGLLLCPWAHAESITCGNEAGDTLTFAENPYTTTEPSLTAELKVTSFKSADLLGIADADLTWQIDLDKGSYIRTLPEPTVARVGTIATPAQEVVPYYQVRKHPLIDFTVYTKNHLRTITVHLGKDHKSLFLRCPLL